MHAGQVSIVVILVAFTAHASARHPGCYQQDDDTYGSINVTWEGTNSVSITFRRAGSVDFIMKRYTGNGPMHLEGEYVGEQGIEMPYTIQGPNRMWDSVFSALDALPEEVRSTKSGDDLIRLMGSFRSGERVASPFPP